MCRAHGGDRVREDDPSEVCKGAIHPASRMRTDSLVIEGMTYRSKVTEFASFNLRIG